MSCCKAAKYRWCENEEVVFHDYGNGKDYCVFHAPIGKKGVGQEKFNQLVFKHIDAVIDNNKENSGQEICDLSGTIFEWDIDFSNYGEKNPLPRIDFMNAIFKCGADFEFAVFKGKADFAFAVFEGKAYFDSAVFKGGAYFSDAAFKGKANFENAVFKGEADFGSAVFEGVANFINAVFKGEADFWDAVFEVEVNFESAVFIKPLFLDGELFEKKVKLHDIGFHEYSRFEGVNLSETSFENTDLRMIEFVNCTWARYLILPCNLLKFFERDALYQDVQMGYSEYSNNKPKTKIIATQYRLLKEQAMDRHDQQSVSKWHYGEKEMERKGSKVSRFVPFSFSNLYWLSSGYGERPLRAGVVLILLIFIFSFWIGEVGIVKYPNPKEGSSTENSSIIQYEKVQSLDAVYQLLKVTYEKFISEDIRIIIHKTHILVLTTLQNALYYKEPDYVPEGLLGKWVIF